MLLNYGVGEDSSESRGLQGDPTSPPWRRSVLGVHWKDWYWSWNSNTLATSCEELTHLKRPWCWERLRAGGEGDDRRWDGWMASPTQWTWVWVNSGSWWWTGRPGAAVHGVAKNWTRLSDWTEMMSLLASQFPIWPKISFQPFTSLGDKFCAQSCPSLCDPMDYSPPGSSVHGISQARILEWVAISFSEGSSPPRDRPRASCIASRFFTAEPSGKPQDKLFILCFLLGLMGIIKHDSKGWCEDDLK